MAFMHGKFRTHPGQVRSAGERGPKAPAVKEPGAEHDREHGEHQAPHGGSAEEHVTKTHPGETQPHPVTGVHAFHAHHTGGGKFRSHTHHDGGDVETREHGSHEEAMSAHDEAFPSEQGEPDGDEAMGGMDFEKSLGGIGGTED